MNIFEQLNIAVRKIKDEYDSFAKGSPEAAEAAEKLNALTMLECYIKSGAWSKKAGSHERIMTMLGYKNRAEAAKKLKTSEESIRTSIYQASERIRDILGFDFIKEVLKGGEKTEDAVYALRLRTDKSTASQVFPDVVMSCFPKEFDISKVDREEFLSNVQALRSVTVESIKSLMSAIPQEMLKTIGYILFCNDPKYLRQSVALYRYFILELESDDLAYKFK